MTENKRKEKKIDYKYNLSMYYSFLIKYKWFLFGVLICSFIAEGITVVNNLLFKKIVDSGTDFSAGNLLRADFISSLLIVAAIFIIFMFIRAIVNWRFLHNLNRLETSMIAEVKRKFFNHIVSLSHRFHTTHKTGSLISRLTRGGSAIERMTDSISFNFMPLVFQLITVAISLIYFDWVSAIVAVATVGAFIAYSLYFQFLIQSANKKANEAEDFEKGNISDIFTNIESIKYFGKEAWIKNKFLKISENTRLLVLKNWDYHRWLEAGQTIILGIGTFLLIYFPLMKFLSGTLTIGTLVFIYSVYGSLASSLYSFVYGMRNFYRAIADFDDLFEYGKVENDIKDKPNASSLEIKEGKVEFKDLKFSYDKREILKDFNLIVPANKKVALVGHSGSGKSTLVKLLYRLYNVNQGKILIDSKNINDVKQESLRNEMSIVPQECVLFDDTVYNNIAFSNPKAPREKVMQAMKFAQLDKIIYKFPKKENTIVGERGVKLSGGEKQRVSIARALLANKKILVLDEATSSLDSQTEHDIQEALKELMKGRTSIVIAHRLSTIMNADLIVVMDKGKIVQKGTHSQLIDRPGLYKQLWNLQKGGYIK